MSVKIYSNFLLSSGGSNFKIIWKIKWDTECEFISCWTVWHHPHSNTSITFGIGGENTIKRTENFIMGYLSLKFLGNQIIKAIGFYHAA